MNLVVVDRERNVVSWTATHGADYGAHVAIDGLGLMLGAELVRDRTTKEPANAETARVLELAKERGLVIGKGGLAGNVLRIKPPMCITKADADFLVECLDEVLEVVASGS